MKRHLLLIILIASSFSLYGGDRFWLQDGDEVLFWGDSITDDGVYPRIIENYVLTYYPEWRLTFYNLGWGGDRASFYPRLERDIRLCKPTKVTIMLGMNDGLYKAPDPEAQAAYVDGIHRLLRILKERSDPEIMLISPTAFDLRCRSDIARGYSKDPKRLQRAFYPPTLRRLTRALQGIADAEGCRYFDLHQAFIELLEDLDAVSGDFQVTAEGVHPNIDGEVFMGLQILQAMGAPREVMAVRIDAGAAQVDSTLACSVEELKVEKDEITLRRIPRRLPMPLYPSVRGTLLRLMDFERKWNLDRLVVVGLDSGWYRLKIDDVLLDVLPAEELAQGVNLSRYPSSPLMVQAHQVFEATERRQDAFYAKWRYVLLKGVRSPRDYTPFHVGVDTEAFDRKEALAFEDQHRLNRPKPHRIEIKRVKIPEFAKIDRTKLAGDFLSNHNRIHIEVDSRLLRSFEPPLCLHGNFSYAPVYHWAILETKRYYSDIPVRMYDDGTHGDRKAGDGVYSIDMFVRHDAGQLEFEVQDGRYLKEYWNHWPTRSHRNAELDRLTKIWGQVNGLGNEKGTRLVLRTDQDWTLKWDRTTFEQAVKMGIF